LFTTQGYGMIDVVGNEIESEPAPTTEA
jgi:hypothetical protein